MNAIGSLLFCLYIPAEGPSGSAANTLTVKYLSQHPCSFIRVIEQLACAHGVNRNYLITICMSITNISSPCRDEKNQKNQKNQFIFSWRVTVPIITYGMVYPQSINLGRDYRVFLKRYTTWKRRDFNSFRWTSNSFRTISDRIRAFIFRSLLT